MTFVARFDTATRRRLVRLRMQVEAGYVGEFDLWTPEGVWFCPVCDPRVGPPNYSLGDPGCPPRPRFGGNSRHVPNDPRQAAT